MLGLIGCGALLGGPAIAQTVVGAARAGGGQPNLASV
jgi:hypothetical protein